MWRLVTTDLSIGFVYFKLTVPVVHDPGIGPRVGSLWDAAVPIAVQLDVYLPVNNGESYSL